MNNIFGFSTLLTVGIFMNVSSLLPTGNAPRKNFQINILTFGAVCKFQTSLFQFPSSCKFSASFEAAKAAWYPDLVVDSPLFVPCQQSLSEVPTLLALILRIFSSSKGKISLIFSKYHSVEFAKNRFETFKPIESSVGGPINHSCCLTLSHRSCHRSVDVPSPTNHPEFCTIRSRPINMPFHPCDSDDLLWHSSRLPSVQYFPQRTWLLKLWGLLIILQLSLPRNASLKLWKSRRPRSSLLFWLS